MSFSSVSIANKSSSSLDRIQNFISVLSELTKFKITFFVSVTTFVGYILHNGKIDLEFIIPALGVLILASGASSLNEYQERNIDSRMERTKVRPIPSGRISSGNAIFISLTLIVSGGLILFLNSIEVFLLGIFTLLWYNGVYTPLKSKTAFAIIPGSLVGALPPIIGWAASGGEIFDHRILAFAAFMFIWQIPHFWLLLMMYDDQYKEAGFPTLSDRYSLSQISKMTYAWIVILILSSSLFFISNISTALLSQLFIILTGLITFYLSFKIIIDKRREIFKKSFLLINSYVLFILIVISIENII